MIKICNTRSESATATPSKRLVSGFLLLLASVFTTPALAQSCDPEKLYDIITSSFHQSVAQRTDGSWAGWGQQMGASAGNVLSPQDLNGVNYSALGTAAPLLVTSGSNVTSHQTIMLATDGLYAWGGAGTVINAGIKAGNNFQKFAVNAKADGLPTGVVPDDVDQLFATYRLLTIVTKTGDAWVLGNQSSNVPALLGDNSTATDNQWHRVQRPADPSQSYNATTNPLVPLQNVFALRGQRGNAAGRGAMMALTNTGGVVEAWTWGPATFLGDGSAVASRPHAVRMTLPAAPVAGAVPKMIGVTGRDTNNTNSYFVLFDSGHLYSLGNNSQRQLGDFTTTERTSWVAVERPTPGDSNVSAGPFTDVKFISVQEHDIGGGNGGAAAALITDGGVLYTWGSNEGRMIGRIQGAASVANGCPATNICNPGIPEAFLPSTHFAKLVEVGGHTTVYMRERSAKFCYVGHRIAGSMGHGGNENNSNYGPFNCEETPVLNICGSTGYDYGDAPFVYEAGGGGNLASHFYIEQEYPNPPQVGVDPENRLYLGENWPRVNDDTPHSVVISTDNTAPLGDCGDWGPGGCEEDAPTNPAQLTLPDTATSHAFDIRVFNEALDADGDPVPARLYAWVDWNNNGVFEPGEYFANGGANGLAIPQNPVPGTGQTITLNWTGLSGLTPGWRYVRLRLTTATNLADLPATPNLDERALRFAGDGEMEDFRVLIVDEDAPPNEPPVAIDVHADAVTPTAPPARLLVGGLDAALQGWDGDGTVVSYRVQTLPACHVPGSGPLPAYPAGGCRLYKRVGVTLTPLTAGEPITLAQAQDLWFETTLPTNTSFTFRAIDDDGDESVNMACDSLVNDCDNTDLLPRPGVMESRDAIFTIPVTQPVLSIEKTVSVDPGNFEIGVPASYTLTVTNTNAPTYADTDITDVIPAGLTIGALPLGCDLNPPASQTVVCTIPAPLGYGLVVNDNVASFVIPVTPAVGISNPVSNTASVTGGGSDTNCTLDPADPDCSSTVITDVDGSDMAAAFGPIPSVVSPGQVLNNLTLVCTNNGPGAAANPSCLPTVDEGAISNLSCLPNPLPTSLPVGGDITCTFTYTAPGTLGGTDTPETGVTFTGTTGADNDTDPTNNVDTEEATIIDAVDDTTSAPGGSTGNTFPLGGNDQFPPGSTFSYTGGTCANGSVNAGGTATFDATPNPCTVEYQVCAPSPNDSQCDTATLTVTSEEADMTPAFGGIPTVLAPGEVVNNATLTCTNAGPSSATDATCVPDVDLGSITNLVCVPPQPVASLPAGNSIVCTFDYTAPGTPGGTDTPETGVVFTGTTGAGNDINGGTGTGGNNSTTLNPPIIDAVDDTTSAPGGSTGNTFPLGGNDQFPPGSTFSYTGGTCANGSVNAGGTATFDATPNPCTVEYQVCAPSPNDSQCDTATLTVTSEEADMTPAFGGIPAVLEPGEVVNNATLTCTNAGPSSATDATCVPDVDLGSITNLVCVPPQPVASLPAGNSIVCTFDYAAPGIPGGEDTAPIGVVFTGTTGAVNDNNGGTTPGGNNSTTLNPPIIDALDDDFTGTSIDGATGGDTPSVVGNDTVGGDPAVIGGNVSLTPGIPSNPGLVMDPNTGIITVPALLPPGVYTYPYEICVLPATAPPTCETATATLEVSEAPSLSIVKSVTSAGPYTVGDVIAYSFLVTNTGNVTLTDVAVNDAILDAPGAVCPVTTLAPSASTTCTGSYTVQASDVPNSNVHNVATAEGVPPGPPGTPPVPSDPDDEDTVIQNPSLTIVKSVTSPGPYTGGSVISYSFLVTNTGNTVLNNVAVIDPILDAPGATCPVTTLNPTESTTCTGSYTVQPGDVETGNVHNVATAEGTPTPTPNTPTPPSVPSDPDEEDTPIEQNPSLSIVKSVTSGDQYALGDVIAYSFLVTNTGDVTLTGIVVNDPILDAPAVCDATTLVPSASTTCTGSYTVQPADVTNGNVHNEATATGTPPGSPSNPNPSDVDSPPDVEDTPVQNPSLTIVKSVTSAGPYTVGDVIAYSFLVENTGNTVLTGVAVNDSILDAPAVCGTTTLNPGDTTTCTGSYTVQASDVPNSNVHNVATAEGVPPATPTIPNPPPVPSLPDDEDTEIQNPSLTIVKSVTSPGPYTGGSTIDYSFLVENTGNTVLTGVVVIDPILDAPAVCGTTTLNPGDTTICTGSYVVQPGDVEVGNVHNVATAEGTPPPTTNTPNPLPVPSDPDEEDTPIEQNPSLSIVKSSAPGPYTGGGVIAYSFLVTNTGDVTLTEVAVNDPILDAPGAICPVTTLAPGASTTCTGSYTVQQADVEAGDVYNVATAGGTPPGSPTNPNPPDVDSPPDDENTPIEQNPSMTVIKTITSTGPYSEDSVIAYQFVVTNTGDVTLTGVTLTDPLPGLSVPACAPVQPAILAPTETMTCTANYTVTEADVQNGSVLNTATVSGQPPGSPTNPNPPPVGDDDNEVAEMAPLLSVAKALTAESIVTDGLAQPGELLTYTITVSNGAGVVAPGTVVNEVVPVGTEFVSGSPTWSCAAGAAAGTACTTQVIVPAYASGTPGQVTATFTVRVLDPLPESVQSIVNVASINGEPPADCVADPAAPTCVTTPTLNLYFDKTVVSVDTIGPNSHVVHYALTIRNVGASPATYTLSDTPGYTTSGVSFNGDVQVGTTGGTVNPALLGASFTPANGVTVQVSDLNVAIASGVTHVYTLATPIAVDADALANGACVAGTPGNGLFNAAAISGSVPQSDNACAPAPEGGGDLAIRLTKTVELAVDFNSNGWGDVGDVLNYEFLIENVGGEPLRALHLLDPQVFDLACDTQTVSGQPIQVLINSQVFRGDFELLGTLALQPGDGVQCWATHELTAADVELRRVVNTAIATGRGAANEAVSSVSTAIYSAFP